MKRLFILALSFAFLSPYPGFSAPLPQSFADLAEAVTPAVVNVSTVQKLPEEDFVPPNTLQMPLLPGSPFEEMFRDFFGGMPGSPFMMPRGPSYRMPRMPSQSLGSGFIIDKEEGLIVTNYHVIENAEEIQITLNDDTKLDAEIVGYDDKIDVALLRTDPTHLSADVDWGDSDALRVGDWILAVGNPFGLGGTVTAGIVSARQRNLNSGPYDNYIQTDASIQNGRTR